MNPENPVNQESVLPENKPEVKSEIKTEVVDPAKNEYYDKYLRALADYQNYQKRARLEADRTKEETTRKMLLDFLPIYDNFELIADSQSSHNSTLFSSVKDQFSQFLDKHGVFPIVVMPEMPYDSSLHEVMVCVEKEGVTSMVVEQIFRPGFMLNDKVLRSAQVKVLKPKV